MSKDINIDLKDLPTQLERFGHKTARYLPITFLIVLAAVYAFVIVRINTLSDIQPASDAVTSQTGGLASQIDKKAIGQLQTLEDNSVNVQALFDEARNNPFNE